MPEPESRHLPSSVIFPLEPTTPNLKTEADPAQIRALAATLTDQAWVLSQALPGFSDTALGVNDAFGWLGPSEDILSEYLDMANDCVAGLGDLMEALGTAGGNLEVTATNYERAELASTFKP